MSELENNKVEYGTIVLQAVALLPGRIFYSRHSVCNRYVTERKK